MTYEELLRAPVKIHAGRTLTWGISRDVADLLHTTATAQSVTLETGSGRSTLVLLHAGRVVAAGAPAEVLTADRIAQAYRVRADVDTAADGRPRVRYRRPGS